MSGPDGRRRRIRMTTSRLLAAGIAAGPVFLTVWLVQALTRDGFDPTRHPISLLGLGPGGWVQIANFVVTGALLIGFAVGLRRVLHPGRAGTWAPVLFALNGIGLIVAGVFVTDAGAGFPAGAPEGAPESISWHGLLHEVGFVTASVSWLAVCVVLLRRFRAAGRRGWAVACVVAPLLWIVVGAWPDADSLSLRLVLGTVISFGFTAALAATLASAQGFAIRNVSASTP
ncbi:hypothetical protein Voc01_000680 [Virgisporangium ochraceum]|uniref:DUF998 domain-containing protein n=2 Tax=Virgisporangium ochraceum TaxID=65505 RepID=A0A8J3ZPC5_9ACTN|nr:hypothetical protein Voc01_000680 [Virgisporangium ochraceum]